MNLSPQTSICGRTNSTSSRDIIVPRPSTSPMTEIMLSVLINADEQAGNGKDAAACYECGQSAVERKTYRLAARNIALPQLKISV